MATSETIATGTKEELMEFIYDDGGRSSEFTGEAPGDCVTRSIAIATGLPYRQVYDALFERTLAHRPTMAKLELMYGKNARKHASPRQAGWPKVYKPYIEQELGLVWCPTMAIGSGCQVHLRDGELPPVRALIVRVSKHLTAVVDGVIHDTDDPSRDGTRCVYGFWMDPIDNQLWNEGNLHLAGGPLP